MYDTGMQQPSRGQEAIERGEASRRAGQPDAARQAFGEALARFRREGDLPGEARALTHQAQIARDTGNLDWALHEQVEAIALYRRAGDGPGLAHALRHAGEMFLDQDRLANATACLHEALDLYRANADTPSLAMANMLRGVALLANALGEREAARDYWVGARDLYATLDPLFPGENAGVAEADRQLAALAG
jgi:tetratricopeptide (TPR) repeat protein